MEKFLLKVGRRKFLMPIYKNLAKTSETLAWGQKVFDKAQHNYHYVSKSSVEAVLYPNKKVQPAK